MFDATEIAYILPVGNLVQVLSVFHQYFCVPDLRI